MTFGIDTCNAATASSPSFLVFDITEIIGNNVVCLSDTNFVGYDWDLPISVMNVYAFICPPSNINNARSHNFEMRVATFWLSPSDRVKVP